MTATELLDDLAERGIEIRADSGNLVCRPKRAVTPEVRATIRNHKSELLAILAGRCLDHIDPTTWRDELAPNRPGWIRSTCVRCDSFIGNRPVPTDREETLKQLNEGRRGA